MVNVIRDYGEFSVMEVDGIRGHNELLSAIHNMEYDCETYYITFTNGYIPSYLEIKCDGHMENIMVYLGMYYGNMWARIINSIHMDEGELDAYELKGVLVIENNKKSDLIAHLSDK